MAIGRVGCRTDAFVFGGSETGPLKYENQRRAAKELFKDSNIDIAAATHAARHSFVTHAEQAGCPSPPPPPLPRAPCLALSSRGGLRLS